MIMSILWLLNGDAPSTPEALELTVYDKRTMVKLRKITVLRAHHFT